MSERDSKIKITVERGSMYRLSFECDSYADACSVFALFLRAASDQAEDVTHNIYRTTRNELVRIVGQAETNNNGDRLVPCNRIGEENKARVRWLKFSSLRLEKK